MPNNRNSRRSRPPGKEVPEKSPPTDPSGRPGFFAKLWAKTRIPLFVQVFGGFLAGAFLAPVNSWLDFKSADGPPAIPSSPSSQLPQVSLGDLLWFFVIEAPLPGKPEKTQSFEDYDLKIETGQLVRDSRGTTLIERLDVKMKMGGVPVELAARSVPISGYNLQYSYPTLHCAFRLDVMPAGDLLSDNKFLISLGSFDLPGDPEPCPSSYKPSR